MIHLKEIVFSKQNDWKLFYNSIWIWAYLTDSQGSHSIIKT